MSDKIEIEVIAKGLDAVKKDTKELRKELEKTGKEGAESANLLSSAWVKGAALITTAIFGIKKALDFSKEGARIHQSMEATAKSFGVSIDKLVAKLREASGATVDNASLIVTANRAMTLGVTEDLDKMGQLMEVARARAKLMGVDTTSAFNDIVTGVARQSPLILDNLGIITKGWADEAKAAGVAADAQFFLNKVLEEGADIVRRSNPEILTMAEKFDALEASAKNAGDSIKRAMGAETLKIIEDLGVEGENAFDKIADSIVPIRKGLRTVLALLLILKASFVTVAETFTSIVLGISRPIFSLLKIFELLKDGIRGNVEAIKLEFKIMTKVMKDDFKDSAKNVADSWKQVSKIVKSVFGEIDALIVESNKDNRKSGEKAVVDTELTEKEKLSILKQALAAGKTLMNDFFSFGRDLRQADLEDLISNLELQKEARVEANTALFEERLAAIDNENTIIDEIDQAQKEKKLSILEEQKQAAIAAGNEQKKNDIQNEIDVLKFVDTSADRKAAIFEEQKAEEERIQAEFDAKIKAEKRKAAEADKQAAIIQSLINTALAITSVLAQQPGTASMKAIASGIIGGLGLVQTGIIAAKPIPKFAQGTDFSPAGDAMINERAPERVTLPQGSTVEPISEISEISNDNRNVYITVPANNPIEFVNALVQEYGLDIFSKEG